MTFTCRDSPPERCTARLSVASRRLDMPLRMGYAEDAGVFRFEGLGTARREKLEGNGFR